MEALQTIPVLRIFDKTKAREFYIGWLRFQIEWEHRFEENSPLYMEISLGKLKLHLSEHHGDGTPGSHVFVWCKGIQDFHAGLIDKQYMYNKPGLEKAFWGEALTFTVNDPFNNRISFNEELR